MFVFGSGTAALGYRAGHGAGRVQGFKEEAAQQVAFARAVNRKRVADLAYHQRAEHTCTEECLPPHLR